MTWWKFLRNVPSGQQLLRSAWREGFRPGSPAALGFALACVTLAAAVRFTSGLFSSSVLSFATFYPATLIVTLVGGLWLGILVFFNSASRVLRRQLVGQIGPFALDHLLSSR
jgi:hypothetical protein